MTTLYVIFNVLVRCELPHQSHCPSHRPRTTDDLCLFTMLRVVHMEINVAFGSVLARTLPDDLDVFV